VSCGFQGGLEQIGGPERACDADDRARIGGGWEIGEELSGGEAGAGIDDVGSDFNEGDKDESALGEAGMREFEVELREDEVAVEEEIEVEGARAVGEAGGAVAAEEALDGKQGVEEDARGEIGRESNDGVEEAGLGSKARGKTNGGGGVERGVCGDAAERGEVREDGGERGVGIAGRAGEVGAEGDVGEGH